MLNWYNTSRKKYPKSPRRATIWDQNNEQVIEVPTNNMYWAASTIAELYRARWQVGIFFREIKRLLHIKSFMGTSGNAVMVQIWTAPITIPVLKTPKQMAPLQSGRFYQAQYVREDRPPILAGPSL